MPLGQQRGIRSRTGTAGSPRIPLAIGRSATAAATDRPALRLALSKGVLGLELDAPFSLGPIRVVELLVGLPKIRFPIDLSGGVARFRHRRGELLRVALQIGALELARWAAPRLRGLFGETTPELSLSPTEGGLLVGLRWGPSALAFDLILAPMDGDLRLLPERARGIGLSTPPQVLALRALAAVATPFGKPHGGIVVVPEAAALLGRHLLPPAGGRAPSAVSVRWEAPRIEVQPAGTAATRLVLTAAAGAAPPALTEQALRALELAELAGEADDAAFAGDLDRARRLYYGLLEIAPRHPEASQRAAWIDVVIGDRAESALSTIVDAMPVAFAGVLGGELLTAVGDHEGARAAFARGAQAEPYGPLAALTWLAAARLAGPLDARFEALDQAITRSPGLEPARWARLEARLDLGDLRGARADVEHLEAATSGSEARHAVWRRAADAFLARGFIAESTSLFERALRYAPDSVEAVAGLARSLRAAGQDRRALDLFARAVALAARAGGTAHAAEIELARGLAEVASDRPAAVARVRAIPAGSFESLEARLLEGRWRAELGDLAGAALAFGRLRDAVELAPPADPDRAAAVAAMLTEAAAIEERERDDLHAAQRSLGLALRLRPRDRAIAQSFRRVAGLAAAPVRAAPPVAPPELPSEPPPPSEREPEEREADDERLVQALTDRLRANPHDHGSAMQLADALSRLGRDLDLLALLSARMEEGDLAVREEVGPRRREVLLRLAVAARAEGRASEGELYEMMANADD